MKKIFSFAAALAVIFTASCNKEMNPSEGLAPEVNTVKVTMNVTAGDPLSKMVMNGNQFAWEIGDEVKTAYYKGTLKAISSGSAATFEGDVTGFPATKANMYVFYSENGTVSSASCTAVIPEQQSGLAVDINQHVLWSSWVGSGSQHYFDADGKEISSGAPARVEIDAEMVPNFSVLKFNVPQELGLTSITITADANIAGSLKVNAARIPTSSGNNKPEDRIIRSSDTQYNSIEVSRKGEVISGDVYVIVAPNAFDKTTTPTSTSWELYYNTATKLKFTLTNQSGSVDYEAKLSDCINMGELKDLGTLPLNIMTPKVDAGKLCLTDATTLTVGIDNPNPACTYYYEIGASKTECKTPTTASASFDPSKGFNPEITGTFDRYFIKVLAHTEQGEYRDVVLTASLRNWKFSEGSPVRDILSSLSGKTLEPGFVNTTTDGIEVYNNKYTKKDADGQTVIDYKTLNNYEQTDVRIAYTSALVQLSVTSEYDSDIWMSFYVDRNTCVGYSNGVPNKRGYRLFYNNSQSTSDYWAATVNANNPTKGERYNLNVHVSDKINVSKGDKFGLRGDGKHVYYGIAMLEVL